MFEKTGKGQEHFACQVGSMSLVLILQIGPFCTRVLWPDTGLNDPSNREAPGTWC